MLHRTSAGCSPIHSEPQPGSSGYHSSNPTFNHSDTLIQGAERTGTVFLRLSDLSSYCQTSWLKHNRPAGQALVLDTSPIPNTRSSRSTAKSFAHRSTRRDKEQRDAETTQAGWFRASPALVFLLSETLFHWTFFQLFRYHVRLAWLCLAFSFCGTLPRDCRVFSFELWRCYGKERKHVF